MVPDGTIATNGIGALELWLDLTSFGATPGEVHYLNGIVATHGGDVLLVAAQGTGI